MDPNRIAPDQRVYLKIKIKSLAAEARIIRAEELKRPGPARTSLHLHRTQDVRKEARDTLLAYGFLRGRTLEQIETRPRTKPRWVNVQRMVERYGPRDPAQPGVAKEVVRRFEQWKGGQ